jgi:hypothetical protein
VNSILYTYRNGFSILFALPPLSYPAPLVCHQRGKGGVSASARGRGRPLSPLIHDEACALPPVPSCPLFLFSSLSSFLFPFDSLTQPYLGLTQQQYSRSLSLSLDQQDVKLHSPFHRRQRTRPTFLDQSQSQSRSRSTFPNQSLVEYCRAVYASSQLGFDQSSIRRSLLLLLSSQPVRSTQQPSIAVHTPSSSHSTSFTSIRVQLVQ